VQQTHFGVFLLYLAVDFKWGGVITPLSNFWRTR